MVGSGRTACTRSSCSKYVFAVDGRLSLFTLQHSSASLWPTMRTIFGRGRPLQAGIYVVCLTAFLFFGYDQGVFGGILRMFAANVRWLLAVSRDTVRSHLRSALRILVCTILTRTQKTSTGLINLATHHRPLLASRSAATVSERSPGALRTSSSVIYWDVAG